jgi:SOS response associated peptidase (SRAP)
MPVILCPDNYTLWLDPALTDLAYVSRMLRPFEPALMRRYPVSTRVNQVENERPILGYRSAISAGGLLVDMGASVLVCVRYRRQWRWQ